MTQARLVYLPDGTIKQVKTNSLLHDFPGAVSIRTVTALDGLLYLSRRHVADGLQGKGWGKESHGAVLLYLMMQGSNAFQCLTSNFNSGKAQASILRFYGWTEMPRFRNASIREDDFQTLWILLNPSRDYITAKYEEAKASRIGKNP